MQLSDIYLQVVADKYKPVIANLLQELSKTSQIIATTSDLNMVNVGNAFYFVGLNQNNIPDIKQVTSTYALTYTKNKGIL